MGRTKRLTRLIDRIAECCTTAVQCAVEAQLLVQHPLARERVTAVRRARGPHSLRHRQRNQVPVADASTMRVSWRGKLCSLDQATLFRLFERLLRRPNVYVSYEQLLADVWGGVKADGTIRSAVRHLKRRLKEAGMRELSDAIRGRNQHYVLLLDGGA